MTYTVTIEDYTSNTQPVNVAVTNQTITINYDAVIEQGEAGNIAQDLLPTVANVYDIGSASDRFADGYFAGNVYADNITQIESDLSAVEGNVTILQGNVATLTNGLSNTNANVAVIVSDLANTNSNVAALTSDLGNTNSNVTTLQGNVATLTSALANTDSNVSGLTSALANTNANVLSLSNTVANNSANITTLQGNVATLSSGLANANSNITTLQGNVVTLTNEIGNTNSNVSTLAGRVTNIESNVASATGTILTGTITANSVVANTVSGTLQTAAQPNITSVGALTSLSVSGDATISGNLQVDGTTTTVNSNVVTINDKFINVANNASTSSLANGGGLGVGPVGSEYAKLEFDNANTRWTTNIGVGINGAVTATGNVTGSNVIATDAVQGVNVVASGTVTAIGNISGAYILGNGSQLTGLPAGYTDANATSLLAAFGSNTITTTGNVATGNLAVTGAATTTGAITATGNLNANNVIATRTMTVGQAGNQGLLNLNDNGRLRLYNNNNNRYLEVQVDGNIATNYTMFLPASQGAANTVLTNDGTGKTSWQAVPAAYGNANVAAYLPTYTGNVGAGNIIASSDVKAYNVDATNDVTGAYLYSSGNVDGVNLNASSDVNAYNVNVTNEVTAEDVVATGTLTVAGSSDLGNIVIDDFAVKTATAYQDSYSGGTRVDPSPTAILVGDGLFGGNTVVDSATGGLMWTNNARFGIAEQVVQDNTFDGAWNTQSNQLIIDMNGETLDNNRIGTSWSLQSETLLANGTHNNVNFFNHVGGRIGISIGNGALGPANVRSMTGFVVSSAVNNTGSRANTAIGVATQIFDVASGTQGIGNIVCYGTRLRAFGTTAPDRVYGYYFNGPTDQLSTGAAGLINSAIIRQANEYYYLYNNDDVAQVRLGSLRRYHEYRYDTATSGSITIDKNNAQVQHIAPTGNVTITGFSNFVVLLDDGANDDYQTDTVTLIITQGATPYTITMPTGSDYRYAAGANTVPATANSTVMISVTGYNIDGPGGPTKYLITISPEFL